MKLLRGCVSAEYKDRKYPGRFGRGQEVADDIIVEEEEGDKSDNNMSDSNIWTRGGARQRIGANKKGLNAEDINKLKNMSGDE